MGTVCSAPGTIYTPLHKTSKFTFSDPIEFESFYTISERILSDSDTSQIRLCKQNSSQSIHALKIVKHSETLEPQILKSVSHPNIIKFVQSFSFPSQTLIVLEYLPHGDLSHYLKKHIKIPENSAKSLIKDVLKAVNHLHSLGIYHRDIKPDNILLESIGKKGLKCKLTDFDSAGYIRGRDKSPFGTLPYMAPETFTQSYDEKIDLWSCGILLYKTLTGHLLFFGRDPEEIELKIRTAPINFDPTLSSLCKNLLFHLLTRDPLLRISAQQALNHSWFTTNELCDNNHLVKTE